jgi:uncharacterized protein (TIGR00251 family)
MEGIKPTDKGVLIDIEVSPNAKREGIKGYNGWRRRIMVDMKEKPEKFKVNKELISFFSNLFKIPKNRVKIVNGEKNPLKTILLEGVDVDEAEKIIGRYIGKS